jgi:transposase
MHTDEMMIGLDPHKASNTIAVLDRAEAVQFRRRFDQSEQGIEGMLAAVAAWPNRVWAVEGGHGMGRNIAQRLVAAGETVIDVPAKLASRVRVYSTGHGNKTDDTDAVAVARAALHSRNLRRVTADDSTVRLKLLSDRRRELVGLRTQAACRVHRLFLELIPGGARTELSAAHATKLLDALQVTDVAGRTRVELAREHVADIERLDAMIKTAGKRITEAVKDAKTSVTDVYGVGPINGALILGEVGNIARFDTRDQFASYAGTAPLSVSSGDHNRHRLSRAGNRQLNSAIHIAAITQIRNDTPGRAYYRRKLDEGKSPREALRCLKRRITDAVWRQLRADLTPHRDNPETTPTADAQLTPRPTVGTGSRRGHSKASAPRRKLITPPATRQKTSSTARLEPAP